MSARALAEGEAEAGGVEAGEAGGVAVEGLEKSVSYFLVLWPLDSRLIL